MRVYKSYFLIGALLLVAANGCSNSADDSSDQSEQAPATTITTVNTICPIEGGEVNPELTAEWNGKTVGFCCAPCLPVWNELSEDEKQAKLAATDSAASSEDDTQEQESTDAT